MDKPMTLSQKLRMVIYRQWEESKEKAQGLHSEVYYERRMREIIEEESKKLNPPPPNRP